MDINVKCKLTLLGKMGENLSDLGLDKELVDITQRTWCLKGKLDKLNLVKM